MSARRISFFTALFLLGNIGAQDPSYPQVMRQLYGTYKMEELPFAKPAHRPDGWVLVLQEYTEKGPVPVAEHALWKPGDQRWRRLPVPRRERPVFDEDSLKELGMRLEEAYRYERCRYYGYPQWSWDVIRKFGQKPDLSAALLESLARACAEYGMGFMMPHQWGAPANPNWPGRQGWTGKASKLQADSFEHYARLEVATLQRLIRIDPNYEVLVGHVRQKLANEYVYFAQTLIQAGHDDRAMYWAKQAQYDASMLDWSYNLLAGLPQDAILISGGDNDTYPLWYLQLCRNMRRDVTVINQSLLGLKEYRDMLSSGNSMLGKAAFNAYQQHREQEERYYVSLGSRGTADARLLLETYYSGDENPELDAHSFVLDSGLNQGIMSVKGSFVSGQDVHLIDLMLSNKRTVLFTAFCEDELQNSWQVVKVARQHLSPSLYPETSEDSMGVAAWITEIMRCPGRDSLADPNRMGTNRVFLSMFATRAALALEWCRNQGEEALKAKVLEKVSCTFTRDNLLPEFSQGSLLAALYRCGEIELGNRMFAAMMDMLLQRKAYNEKMQQSGIIPADDALRRYDSPLPFVEYLEYEFSLLNPDIGRGIKRAERLAEVKALLSTQQVLNAR